MEYNQIKEFIKQLHPRNTPIDFALDKSCIHSIEFPYLSGEKHPIAKIYYNKLLVSVQTMLPFYIDIPLYMEEKNVNEAIALITESQTNLLEKDLQDLRDADVRKNLGREDHDKENILQRIVDYSGKTHKEVLKKSGLQ